MDKCTCATPAFLEVKKKLTNGGARPGEGKEGDADGRGQIMTPARSRMQHARGDKLVYCHEALHMRAKLQTVQSAGYVQKAVQWDSDSDSDASDDEEDLKV